MALNLVFFGVYFRNDIHRILEEKKPGKLAFLVYSNKISIFVIFHKNIRLFKKLHLYFELY
jgi:hypothetical protein